jgi:hypothetical protein
MLRDLTPREPEVTKNGKNSMEVVAATGPREQSSPQLSELMASLALQIGLVICVLALLPKGVLGIGLCNSPKELALYFFGLTAASLCLVAASQITIDWTDLLLGLFLLISIVSGCFATVDRLEAISTVGVTFTGAAVFWSARDLATGDQRWPLLARVRLAVFLVALGVLVDAFTEGHGLSFAKPGGMQANRNWAGHLLALGMPLMALQRPQAGSAKRLTLDLLTLFACSAALVLTRTRAAWLGAIFGTGFPLLVITATSRRSHASTSTQPALLCALALGVVAAVYTPTRLSWKSPHPYMETVKNLLAHNRGSGLGRIVQCRHSMAMVMDHPALGVGPGNWEILYPAYLLGIRPPVIARLWHIPSRPSSDWVGFTAERGVPATVALLAALVTLAMAQIESLGRSTNYDERAYCSLVALGTLIALTVVGSFDAVLQLPAPTYLVFLTLGALAPRGKIVAALRLSPARRTLIIVTILLVAAILAAFTIDEIVVVSLIARQDGGGVSAASRFALDSRWFVSEWEWSRRGGPGCL